MTGKNNTAISVRLPARVKAAVVKAAKAKGYMNESDYLRYAIRKVLKEDKFLK